MTIPHRNGIRTVMMATFLVVLTSLAVLYGYTRFLEGHAIFFPTKIVDVTPADVGLAFEEVWIRTDDGVRLHGWWIPSSGELALLFFHGNAGNISDRLEKIRMFHDLGLSVFIIDYRGYGRSEGRPSEEGLYRDADAAYEALLQRVKNAKDIIVYGESLGGVPAVDLGQRRTIGALILDSTLTNARDMKRRVAPFVPSWFMSVRLDSLAKIPFVAAPKLIIHSTEDEVVPFWQGRKLYEAAAQPKVFLELRGSHNEGYLISREVYLKGVENFLKSYCHINHSQR